LSSLSVAYPVYSVVPIKFESRNFPVSVVIMCKTGLYWPWVGGYLEGWLLISGFWSLRFVFVLVDPEKEAYVAADPFEVASGVRWGFSTVRFRVVWTEEWRLIHIRSDVVAKLKNECVEKSVEYGHDPEELIFCCRWLVCDAIFGATLHLMLQCWC